MSAQELLSSLRARGVAIWAENGCLHFRATKGVVGPDERRRLAELKNEICALLDKSARYRKQDMTSEAALTCLQLRWLRYRGKVARRMWVAPNMVSRIRGGLHVDALARSLDALVERHESLRTRIVEYRGIPQQIVDTSYQHHLELIDISEFQNEDLDEEISRRLHEFLRTEIDVAVGPLFSTRLLKLSEIEYVLVVAIDHMVGDGESLNIVHREMWTLYSQAMRGLEFSVPSLPMQFADYAVWQLNTHAVWHEAHEGYWREKLAGLAPFVIPHFDELREVADPVGAEFSIELSQGLSEQLRNISKRERVMLPLLVMTIYLVAMARWCDRRDLVVAFQSNGRHRPDLENLVGFVTHILYLRVCVCEGESRSAILQRVAEELYSAYEHIDFDRVPDLFPSCKTDLGFSWTPMRGERSAITNDIGDINVISSPYYDPPPPYRFGTLFFDGRNGIYCTVWYRPDVFALKTVECFGNMFRSVAEEFAASMSGGVLPN